MKINSNQQLNSGLKTKAMTQEKGMNSSDDRVVLGQKSDDLQIMQMPLQGVKSHVDKTSIKVAGVIGLLTASIAAGYTGQILAGPIGVGLATAAMASAGAVVGGLTGYTFTGAIGAGVATLVAGALGPAEPEAALAMGTICGATVAGFTAMFES